VYQLIKEVKETTIDFWMNKIIRLIPMGIIIIDLTTLKEMTLKIEIEEIITPKIITLGVEIKTIFLNKIEIKDNGVKTVKTSIKIATMIMKNKIVKTSIILRKELMILIIKIYNNKRDS